VALVVGGSKGIGLESARMLAAEGCRVAIVARGQKHIDLAVNGIRADGGDAIGVIADMTQRDQIERAASRPRPRAGRPRS
jgi:3-oxoacyl-[acyl-carrier protein] reductase